MSNVQQHQPSTTPAWHWFVDTLPTPTFVKNQKHQIVAVSNPFCELVGATRDDVLGFQDFEIHPGVQLLNQRLENATLQTGEQTRYEREFLSNGDQDKAERTVLRINQTRTFDPQQNPCLIGSIEDVTQLAQMTRSLESAERQTRIAFAFDALTGLTNRTQLRSHVINCLNNSQRSGDEFALLLFDLNEFNTINSMAGFSVGDQVLRVIASRIKEVVRGHAIVSRLSADEFVVLLPSSDEFAAGRVANQINQMIEMPVDVESTRFALTSSIGISMYPKDGTISDDLLRKADQAMLKAKAQKPYGSIQFYQPQIGADVERKLLLTQDLAEAVRNDEIELHFQPIVRHRNGQEHVIGYESLARWMRDATEFISPAEFIPLLEDTGQIVQAGENILSKACEFIASRPDSDVYVSVNVSGRQLQEAGFVQMVDRIIQTAGIRHDQVALELTETLAMNDSTTEVSLLTQLTDLGIKLLIDDFGTGYSNLSRLRELPFDILKIDRSLVQGVPNSRSDCAILRTLIRMASEMEMGLVVEGIEEPEQRDYLIALGVDTFQGYLFGKPKPMKLALT